MARFNILSLIFLLTSITFFLFSEFSITGNIVSIKNYSLNLFNLMTVFSFVLFLLVFLSGKKLEAILVPTGTSKLEEERIRKGAEHYHSRKSNEPSVLISGTIHGKNKGRFITSQPGNIYKKMRRKGIPRNVFLFEPESEDTAENVFYSAKKIREKGINKLDVVSNPSHLWRFKFLFDKAKKENLIDEGVEINYIPTRRNFLFEDVYDAIYGATAYFKDLVKWRNKSLKSLEKID